MIGSVAQWDHFTQNLIETPTPSNPKARDVFWLGFDQKVKFCEYYRIICHGRHE